MNFFEALEWRYATKLYDSEKKVAPETIEILRKIVDLSPSSINSQPWEVSFVVNNEMKEKLAAASYFNEDKINQSSLLVVFNSFNDISAYERWAESTLPQGAIDYYNNMIKVLPSEQILDWFARQVYLNLGVFLSGCAVMGLDSTPMEGLEPKKYNAILGNTTTTATVAVAIGYRSEKDRNQPSRNPKSRKGVGKSTKLWL